MAESSRFDRIHIAALALLAAHCLFALDHAWHSCVSIDEYADVAAGLSHWQLGNYESRIVNPPLTKALAAMPFLFAGVEANFKGSRDDDGDIGFVALGEALEKAAGGDYFTLFFWARVPNMVLSAFGGWLVYRWSRAWYGPAGGLTSLALWSFCPNLIAHGSLATPDMGGAVFGFLATYAFWRFLQEQTWSRCIVAGVLLGLAQLCKFTLLILYPSWALIGVAWLILRSRQNDSLPKQALPSAWPKAITQAAAIVFASLFVINAGYSFEGSFQKLGDFSFQSETLTNAEGDSQSPFPPRVNRLRDTWLGQMPVPLPRNFVRGIDRQKVDFEVGLYSYLRGELRREGWWYYYLYAFAIKTSLGTLVMLGLAFLVQVRGCGRPWEEELALIIPALAVLVLVSSQTGFNHHLRYILPFYPFLFVWAGKVGAVFSGRVLAQPWHAALAAVVLAALAWNLISVVLIRPHYLSYFNQLVGGPHEGHRHLNDSNIDWGQDLFALKEWLDQHPEAKDLRLAYFGMIDPRKLDISYRLPPRGPSVSAQVNTVLSRELGPQVGWYAISVFYLTGSPFRMHDGQGGQGKYAAPGIYRYFQEFNPVAKAGYSIFIYHISATEANRVRSLLNMPPLEQGKD